MVLCRGPEASVPVIFPQNIVSRKCEGLQHNLVCGCTGRCSDMDIGYSYDYGYGWLGWVGYEVGKVNRVMCCCSHHLASLGPPYLRPPAPTPILLTTVMRMMRMMRMKMRMMVGQLPIMLFSKGPPVAALVKDGDCSSDHVCNVVTC